MRARSLGLSVSKNDAVGSKTLLGGDDQWGYYGRVSASELISGDELASMIGLTAGTSQYSNVDWLKFNSNGKIIYSPMKSFRHSIAWDDINSVDAVYGNNTVKVNGLVYKIRLWSGAIKDPVSNSEDSDAIGSEWNRLMLPVHEKAPSNWGGSYYTAETTEDWGADFTDEDLLTHTYYGVGSRTWCQEKYSSWNILRGGSGVDSSGGASWPLNHERHGWRPVLELVTSDTLQAGNDLYGYYGKYQGIITPSELISLAGITEGTTKNDAYNNPNEDITWLKFSHNYKTLFVADRTIHYGVSWNHLDSKGVVFGKVVDIDGQKYLLRLLQGANVNPASTGGGANSNDEWDSLIVQFTPNTEDSHWSDDASICQETHSNHIDVRVYRGKSAIGNLGMFAKTATSNNGVYSGYRPVLEVL